MKLTKVEAFLCLAIVACLFAVGVLVARQDQRDNKVLSAAMHAEVPLSAASAGAATVLHENIPDAGAASAPAAWVPLIAEDWPKLLGGKWTGAERGDAVNGENKLVVGGARVEIFQGKPGSKTPYNIRFFVPRKGDDSETGAGGCGLYPSGEAYCRGYGLPKDEQRVTLATFERRGDLLRVGVSGVLTPVELVRGSVK